ncbi:MAG: trypsin-like peptidase domain-containing protein [Candidatus Riflebacteria bacterium]|nr:trypsin-like peptidase domain-containing protein [Candidatus Riflebacteria bacterium]
MSENKRSEINGNLIAALVAILIFVIVGLVFWYRQSQREMAMDMADRFLITRPKFVDDRPRASLPPQMTMPPLNIPQGVMQRIPMPQSPQMGSLVALPQSLNQAQIVESLSPTVVAISIEPDQGYDQAMTTAKQQQSTSQDQLFVTQQLKQNNRGARMGGWGLGPGGELVCPRCGTRLRHERGVPCYTVRCPRCGAIMQRAEAPRAGQPDPGSFQYSGTTKQAGTGLIVHHDGFVLTNLHTLLNAAKIYITVSYNKVAQTYPAKLVAEYPEADLGILQVTTNGGEAFSHATLGDSNSISLGDKTLAIGDPYGPQQNLTSGEITNTNRTVTVGEYVFNELIQTNAPITHDYSGGPLVNTRGEVIGISTAIYLPYVSDVGFAIPINFAKEKFADFIDDGKAPISKSVKSSLAQFDQFQGNQMLQTVALPVGPVGPAPIAGCPVGGQCPTGVQCPAVMSNSPSAQCPAGMQCPTTNAACPAGVPNSPAPLQVAQNLVQPNANQEQNIDPNQNPQGFNPPQDFAQNVALPLNVGQNQFQQVFNQPQNTDQIPIQPGPQCPAGPACPNAQNVATPLNVAGNPGQLVTDLQPLVTQNGWGIRAQTVNAVIQNNVGSPVAFGVVVTQIDPRSLLIGLQRGDIIVRVDGQLIRTEITFWKLLKSKAPGSKVELTVFRGGDKVNLDVTIPSPDLTGLNPVEAGLLGPETLTLAPIQQMAAPINQPTNAQQPQSPQQAQQVPSPVANQPQANVSQPVDPATLPLRGILIGAEVEAGTIGLGNGMAVEELTPSTAITYSLPSNQDGLVVGEVEGAAQTAGFVMGDFIQKINGQPVRTLADFITIMNEVDPQAGANLELSRRGTVLNLTLR